MHSECRVRWPRTYDARSSQKTTPRFAQVSVASTMGVDARLVGYLH